VPQQSPISSPMGTKNVLIIDSNEAMQKLRTRVLRSRGVHVHTAKSVAPASRSADEVPGWTSNVPVSYLRQRSYRPRRGS
jgi:hypothetical protein